MTETDIIELIRTNDLKGLERFFEAGGDISKPVKPVDYPILYGLRIRA